MRLSFHARCSLNCRQRNWYKRIPCCALFDPSVWYMVTSSNVRHESSTHDRFIYILWHTCGLGTKGQETWSFLHEGFLESRASDLINMEACTQACSARLGLTRVTCACMLVKQMTCSPRGETYRYLEAASVYLFFSFLFFSFLFLSF
jgi:hypothetical protein